MLNGGKNDEGTFYPLQDSHMRAAISSVRNALANFKGTVLHRYRNSQGSSPGSEIYQQFEMVSLGQDLDLGLFLREKKQINNRAI